VTAIGNPQFRNSLWLTILFVLGSAVIGQSLMGFGIAWSVRSVSRLVRGVIETLVLLAWILPSSVVAFLWIAYLGRGNGTLNMILHTQGTDWLLAYPMLSIIVFNTWRGAAFSMLLFSAALNAVPPSQLETARLAGASTLQQFRDVVFPHIRGHVLTNTLLISLSTFNDFSPYLLTAGGPNHASETLPVYIYNSALYAGQLGYGSAISADHAGDQPDNRPVLPATAQGASDMSVKAALAPDNLKAPPPLDNVVAAVVRRVLFYTC
jgi:multiple sugar transport system permease protein